MTTVAAEVMEHQSESPSWSMSTEELFQQSFPLHQACRDGDLDKLSALLSRGNVDLYEEDSFTGWSPLHWAANFGKVIFDFNLLYTSFGWFYTMLEKRTCRLFIDTQDFQQKEDF